MAQGICAPGPSPSPARAWRNADNIGTIGCRFTFARARVRHGWDMAGNAECLQTVSHKRSDGWRFDFLNDQRHPIRDRLKLTLNNPIDPFGGVATTGCIKDQIPDRRHTGHGRIQFGQGRRIVGAARIIDVATGYGVLPSFQIFGQWGASWVALWGSSTQEINYCGKRRYQ